MNYRETYKALERECRSVKAERRHRGIAEFFRLEEHINARGLEYGWEWVYWARMAAVRKNRQSYKSELTHGAYADSMRFHSGEARHRLAIAREIRIENTPGAWVLYGIAV